MNPDVQVCRRDPHGAGDRRRAQPPADLRRRYFTDAPHSAGPGAVPGAAARAETAGGPAIAAPSSSGRCVYGAASGISPNRLTRSSQRSSRFSAAWRLRRVGGIRSHMAAQKPWRAAVLG